METMKQVFRSATEEQMPMMEERLACLREAGRVLHEVSHPSPPSLLPSNPRFSSPRPPSPALTRSQKHNGSVEDLISAGQSSAARLVNVLARDFPCLRDEFRYEGRKRPVRFLKRAQIFVADVWACFDGESYGHFPDIDKITMFADYRVPQILNSMGCLYYSPKLVSSITRHQLIESGSPLEIQLRGEFVPLTRVGNEVGKVQG